MRVFFTVFFLLSLFSKSFAQDLNEGLLISYPMNGNPTDVSGNDYDGVAFGVTFGLDRFNNPNSAAYFDGLNDYINFPNIEELKPGLPISFSFWVKYDDLTYENSTVFNTSFEEDINTGIYMNIQSSTGKYQISYGDGSIFYTEASRRTYTSNSIIESETWHFIVISVNSESSMKIFVDCIEMGGGFSGSGGQLQYSNFPGNLGRHDRSLSEAADYFKGAIDDFKYWNRELSEDEISELCDQNLNVEEVTLSSNSVKIHPNPSNGIFHFISKLGKNDYIRIYNSSGQLITSQNYVSTLDLSSFSSGIYFIEFANEECTEVKKIIIK